MILYIGNVPLGDALFLSINGGVAQLGPIPVGRADTLKTVAAWVAVGFAPLLAIAALL